MNQRADTWGAVIENRRGPSFVGRRDEIDAFRLNFLYDVPQSMLFAVHGPPGIGKSALLDRYRAVAREHGVVTAMVDRWDVQLTQEFAAIQAMSVIARQLHQHGTPLTSFSEMLRDYEKALQAIASDDGAPGQAWDLLGGIADDDAWTTRMWDDYLLHTMPTRRSELIRTPVLALTERFVHDLNTWATVRRIVVCFDDWDMVPGYLEQWLLGVLRTGELATKIWFVLAAEEPLASGWDDLEPATARFGLSPLSTWESRLLLQRRGVSDDRALDQRCALGLGHPMTLELLAATPGPLVGSAGRSIVDRFVGGLDRDLRDALIRLVAARRVDEGVVRALLVDSEGEDQPSDAPHLEAKVEAALGWLATSPLVTRSTTGLRFRPGIWHDLTGWARTYAAGTWRAAHRTLYTYYRQQLELRDPISPYWDPDWQRNQAEALYHALIADDGVAALNAAYASLSEVMRHFYPWAGSVVRVMEDASSAGADHRRTAGWTRAAGAVLTALLEGEWQQALTLIDGILAADIWQPEVKQAFRAMRHLVASRLSLAPELEPVPQPEEATSLPNTTAAAADVTPQDRLAERKEPPEESTSAGHGYVGRMPPRTELPGRARETDTDAAGRGKATEVVAAAVQHCRYANEQLAAEAYQAAIEAYDQALALSPTYVAAYHNRGLAYSRLGALDSAIADFTCALELDRAQWQSLHQRGLVQARMGAYDRAVADYDAALRIEPDRIKLISDRANALFRLRAYERAIEDYVKVVAAEPDRIDVYLNLGLAHAATDRYSEALRYYNQAIALDPDRAVAFSHRGVVYDRLGRYPEALADYEHAIELSPRNAEVHNRRGLLYARIASYEQAIESYKQAMALRPDWATPYYNAACAAALSEEATQACVWLARAVGLRERYRAMALNDTDFAAIRDHPDFRTIVKA